MFPDWRLLAQGDQHTEAGISLYAGTAHSHGRSSVIKITPLVLDFTLEA